jgi:hypothetical protein
MNFEDAIYKLYPQTVRTVEDKAFDVNGDIVVYNTEAVQALVSANAYIAKRQAEYPPFTDYLDGIAKGDQAQVQAYIDACLAVKAKYPKGA